MARFATIEHYRDDHSNAAILRHDADGLWRLTVKDAHGKPLRTRDAFVSHKGARIALGKLSDGTMKLVPSAPVAIRTETVYNINKEEE